MVLIALCLLVCLQAISGLPVSRRFTVINNVRLKYEPYMYERKEPLTPENHYRDVETYVSVINATPYPWTRAYSHQYQMLHWDWWPSRISPGETVEVPVERRSHQSMTDTAAEVRYHLEGTSSLMGFQVEYRQGKDIGVRLMGDLETMNNEKESVINIGFLERPGGTGFLLAGREGNFISNNGPSAWMQASLPDVGHLPLRHVCLPRSHHAGMWKATHGLGLGLDRQTLTQSNNLWTQLTEGGIRVLDVRAHKRKEGFFEAHTAKLGIAWHGKYGAFLADMIATVNKFTQQFPGELIIWDLHNDARSGPRHFAHLDAHETDELYSLFKTLNNRISVPDDQDLSLWSLNDFIGNGKSAVLVRVPEGWLDKSPNFPGGSEGFVTTRNYPVYHHWSDKNKPLPMIKDQLRRLYEWKRSRDSVPLSMDWIVTQHGAEVYGGRDIMTYSRPAWRALFYEFWAVIHDEMYPNWIALDDVHKSQQKAMVMAINHCLGARKCGGLGGKVPSLEASGEGINSTWIKSTGKWKGAACLGDP
ncbi:hypothetical protein CDD82_3434 [Ophiocordyceps australis]|uniref:Phosphatidylinositol-specific phospholipase C X domain-containing protein n=1 Tax=Ophiocordyceps australis TaxID=1399860 RepID=A0A2C5ZUV3_9HYPO|nr:hypothetical protein CDD82_3434 [Ophiocordyceps australis]